MLLQLIGNLMNHQYDMHLKKKKILLRHMSEEKHSNTIHSLRLAEIARCPSCANPWEIDIIENDPDLRRQYERMKINPLRVSYAGNGVVRYYK